MSYRLGSMAFGFLIAFGSGAVAQGDDVQIGRFQAFPGSDTWDKNPGVWLLDTATGRIAFCQSGLINLDDTHEGNAPTQGTDQGGLFDHLVPPNNSGLRVSCAPWKSPMPDDDPLGIRSELE